MDSISLEKIDGVLQKLAEKFGQGADYFWPILVKEQFINGIMFASAAVLSLAMAAITATIAKKTKDEDLKPGMCVLTIFLLIIFIPTTFNAVTRITTPEIAALEKVIGMIR